MPAPTWGESVCKECGKSFVYPRKRPMDRRKVCDPCKVILRKENNRKCAARIRKDSPLPPPAKAVNSSTLMHMSPERLARIVNEVMGGETTFSR